MTEIKNKIEKILDKKNDEKNLMNKRFKNINELILLSKIKKPLIRNISMKSEITLLESQFKPSEKKFDNCRNFFISAFKKIVIICIIRFRFYTCIYSLFIASILPTMTKVFMYYIDSCIKKMFEKWSLEKVISLIYLYFLTTGHYIWWASYGYGLGGVIMYIIIVNFKILKICFLISDFFTYLIAIKFSVNFYLNN